MQNSCGSDDDRARVLACQKAADFTEECALGHKADQGFLIARNNFADALIDEVEVLGSGVLLENVLVDHANLVLQMRTQLHDQILAAELEKFNFFYEVKVNHDGDFLFEGDREVFDDCLSLLELLKWNSEVFEVIIYLLAQLVWEMPGFSIRVALLELNVITHRDLVLVVDEIGEVSVVTSV